MKRYLAVIIVLILSARPICFGQVYQVSTPVAGYLGAYLTDFGGGKIYGNNAFQFDTLTETIYFDPVNLTVRQTGFLSVKSGTATTTLTETRQINGQPVSGVLTIEQQLLNGGIYFDTGIIDVHWNDITHNYAVAGTTIYDSLQMVGSYSLATGGQVYSGDFSGSLGGGSSQSPIWGPYTTVSLTDYPHTLALGYPSIFAASSGWYRGSPGPSADFTADNGFSISLRAGDEAGDNYWSFNLPDATATLVPEPTGFAFLGVGFAAFFLFRRKSKSKVFIE